MCDCLEIFDEIKDLYDQGGALDDIEAILCDCGCSESEIDEVIKKLLE